MQRILLQKYVAENFSDYDLLEFCDDGYTGTNFERPGMQEMLEFIKVRRFIWDFREEMKQSNVLTILTEYWLRQGSTLVI